MAAAFSRFFKKQIDLTSVGVERSSDSTTYFCTPKGASIIGWAGVDGIHYCFIRGFGEMVFSVSPMNTAPDYVHPLAKTFSDFLRLLLACGDAAVLEQAWMWDKAKFEAFLKENPPTEEQKKTLTELADQMNLTAMEQPWAYIKSLQDAFDYSKIKYTEDYYDIDMNPSAKQPAPQWNVYFDGRFFGYCGKDHAGTEIRIGQQFEWAGHQWLIPAAYSCSKGLVVDFCMRVDADQILAYMRKWNLMQESDTSEAHSREQETQMNFDNPMFLSFRPRLNMNGQVLRTSHGHSLTYNPCLQECVTCETETKWVMEHYGLDATYGWVISRNTFPWDNKHRPKIKTLSLTMEVQPSEIPGPHFTVKAPGDTFCFVHPLSRTEYTLTVQELERQTLPKNSFDSDRYFYPTHFTVMRFTLSPEPSRSITISDSDDGNEPLEIAPSDDAFAPTARDFSSVMIIGSSDGPTALMIGDRSQGNLHIACSALHFEPVENDITWRITFHEKLYDDLKIHLLGMERNSPS